MPAQHRRSLLVSALLAAQWFECALARASLGGDLASVQADAAALGGVVQANALLSYEVQQIDVPGGLSVREYVGRDGIVFALSWVGPAPPDLQQLLGGYFAAFSTGAAAQVHPGPVRSVRVLQPGLVVQWGGHLRAYTGQACVPGLLPAGVSLADLH
jgi:hypothetical protein